jgi:hypothetical protein
MSDNVTQVEGLDFTVQDHATAPADRMAKSFEHVHHAAEGATRKLGEMTHRAAMSGLAMVGLGFGLREVANKAGEANLELENSAKKIAGVQYTFGGWKKGTTGQEKWNESLQTGTEIVAKLEASEGKLKMTRGELADIYKSTFALGARYNQNQEQQIDLTEKFGAVQKVLGVNAEFAATQVYRMATTGRARGFDDFSKKMKESVGDLKALSEEKRFQKLKAAMGDLMPAAEGMGKGIAGSMFDVRKSTDELTRDLTGPVFKEVTKDFSEWAHELGKVREGGQSAAAEWGGKLVTAFGYLKDATAFIADHWKTIAGIFVATKFTGAMQGVAGVFGASAAAGGAGGAAGGVAGVMNVKAGTVNVSGSTAAALGSTTAAAIGDKLKPSLSDTVGKFTNVAARAGMVTEALGGLYIGLDALAKWALSKQDEGMAKQASAPRAMNALTAGAKAMSSALHEGSVEKTFSHLKAAFQAYGLKPGQSLDRNTVAGELRAMQPELAAKQIAMYGIKGASAKNVQAPGMLEEAAGRITTLLNNFAAQLLVGNPSLADGKNGRALAGKAVTNINVAHLEITQDFKQADPDRVFHNVPRDIVDMVNSPRASGIPAVG